MATMKVILPTEAELTVEEVPLGHPFLRAASMHMAKVCEAQNNEFMLCRQEYKHDPRPCLQDGREVTACAMKFIREVKANCAVEFTNYATCLERSSTDMKLTKCRQTQGVFDGCMKDKLGIERPHFAWMTLTKVHDTNRPRPEPRRPAYLDIPGEKQMDELPSDFPRLTKQIFRSALSGNMS